MKHKFLLSGLMFLFSLSLVAETYSGTCGGNLTWTLDTESGILTISGTGAMTNYTYSSNAPWYSYRESIKTVKIGSSVTSIGEIAFSGCESLTSVTIPNSVTSIGNSAFSVCESLTSVTIPNSVTSIGNQAFYNCSGLTSVTIPNSVTSIDPSIFSFCSNLKTIDIDADNPNYSSEDGVLYNKDKTTLILCPGGKQGAFAIPNSVTSIGENAFMGCSSLTSVTIPNSVTSIGEWAFYGCESLTSVTIGNSVTSIGDDAFHECTGLTSVTIPNSVTSIGMYAFVYCSSLTSATIPNSVTSIGEGAFYDCSSLTSITIPNSVTSIGEYAFYDCSSLTSIVVENGNTKYDSRNNCNAIIETTTNTLIAGCQNTIIPNTVTSIGYSAFCGCSSLTSVTIPNSVTSIGQYAFRDCSRLTSVTIPNSVTSIGSRAFEDCSSLTSVTCEAINPPECGVDQWTPYGVFNGVDKSIPLYVPAQSIDLYKAADQWKDFTNILPITVVGTFSVSATQQVTFAPGNLQYQASTNTWRFAEHQWDMVGMGYGQANTDVYCYIGGTVANSDNRQIGSNYSGWIDLFGWGTSGWNSGANAYQPYSTSTSNSDYYPGGNSSNSLTGNYANADWGVYNQIGDDAPGSWRTLTRDEWNYLFNTRANASSKYGAAKVNGVTGVVVLPDNWTLPVGCGFTASMTSASSWYDWSYVATTNIYTSAQWQLMESAGAVFLPAAGYRDGTSVGEAGSLGLYWSSTQYDTNYAYILGFDSGYLDQGYNGRTYGFSVRLARAAQSEQEPVYSLSVSVEGEGTVTGAGEYKKGTTATLTATAASGYTFSQWSDGNTDNPRTITMTQNLTLTAVFVKKTFIVSFVNYDGTELQSSEVEYGIVPQYSGITPTKPADAQYTYTFAGWDKEVVAVTGDATYTATYIVTIRTYTVTFMDGNTVLGDPKTVEYGQSATAPEVEIPQCRTLAWDKDFSNIASDLTVQAIWTEIPLAEGTCGTNLTWNLDCEGLLTISGTGAMKDYSSSSDVPWYSSRISIKTVIIEDGVTSIGECAFCVCSKLTSITIPNSVTTIGKYAFRDCTSLTSITIPNSVTSIGNNAFYKCSSLTSVHISEIAAWCKIAFSNCDANPLYYAHLYLNGTLITDLVIPDGVTSIKNYAFYGCSSLTSVTIPNSVTGIGSSAFSTCSSLTSVTIPNSVTSIGEGAFYGCSSLTSVTIPNSVTSIGEGAFSSCSRLTSIVVENGNTKYDSRNNCNAIIETTTNTLIAGCQNTIIPNTVTSIGDYAFYQCSKLTSITIPNSVTSIGYAAFFGCSGLTSVTIPNSVTDIGYAAFEYCSGLTYITCEAINPPKLEYYSYDYHSEGIVFGGVDKSIPLYVPAQSIDLYKAADQWKDFTNILPINSSELPSDITLQENETADYYTQFAQDYNGRTVNTATLNRQFTQGKWATLCLPFNVNKAMMMALGLYNRVFAFRYAQQLDDETIQVFFVPAPSIEAGKGYIVNANDKLAQKTSFVFPNVTINTDSDNGDITTLTGYNDGTNRGNLYLVGTLRTGILQGTTTGNTYLGLKDNRLYYPNTATGTSIRAYRGFFRSDIPVNAQRVRIIADGETVTELEVMNGEEDLHEALPARKYIRNGLLFIERNGVTYTAQGQRID